MEFEEFANRIDSPVAVTVMGGGGFHGRNELTTGMIGMHGSQASNMAVDNCDLLIAFGCRFSDRVALDPSSFAKQAKIVQVDIDRSEINKNVMTDHHIIGDARRVLEMLNERVTSKSHREWKEYVFSFPTQTEYVLASETLNPRQITDSIDRLCPRDVIVATDVGQHQMWTIQHLHYSYPGQLLTSGGFGAMGFGLGAAIGAKISRLYCKNSINNTTATPASTGIQCRRRLDFLALSVAFFRIVFRSLLLISSFSEEKDALPSDFSSVNDSPAFLSVLALLRASELNISSSSAFSRASFRRSFSI